MRERRQLPPAPEPQKGAPGEGKRQRGIKLADGQYEMMRMLAEEEGVSLARWLETAIDERAERQLASMAKEQ